MTTKKDNSAQNGQTERQTLSVKEVGNIFSDIDKRILSLYKCSSDDFVTFNNQLKKFHKQINVVSGNASEVLALTGGTGKHDFVKTLDTFIPNLEKYVNGSISFLEQEIMNMERLLKNINSIMLYSRNYKQNLLTYKYLITNLKLSVAYLDASDSKTNENIEKIIAHVAKVNAILPALDNKLNSVKIKIAENISAMKRMVKESSDEFTEFMHQLEKTRNHAVGYTQELHSYIEKLNEKIEACSENVGQIITHLQFQDIVRQKMEHIQEMHKEVMNIVGSFEDTQLNQLSGIQQARYLVQVRDVAELQVAQLSHTNRQYQKAIELISKMFLVIIENITDASLLNVMFPGKTRNQSENFDLAIEKALSHTLTGLTQIDQSNEDLLSSSRGILSILKEIHNEVSTLKEGHESLINQSLSIIDAIQEIGLNKNDQKSLLDNINSLLITNKNLSQIILLNSKNNKSANQEDNRNLKSEKHADLKKIQKDAADIIHNSTNACQKIKQVMNDNDILTNSLIDEIFTSMQEVKYYDYFETIIEEIIDQLNTIFIQLAYNKNNKKRNIKNSAIQHFRNYYTMDSERQIHTGITSNGGIMELAIQSEIEEDPNNGDLELF